MGKSNEPFMYVQSEHGPEAEIIGTYRLQDYHSEQGYLFSGKPVWPQVTIVPPESLGGALR
jgi:hypothetical protein